MSDSETTVDSDELYDQLTNDRTKAARAERTVGDADRVDDPRTAIRYVGDDRGVDQFQVAFTNTQGFPLGKTQRSIQPENHIRDWMEKNDAELIDAREEEMFAPTASEDSVGVALETDGGETVEQAEYRVEVWATSEFTPRVTAETEEEAKQEAREHVRHEQFGAEVQTVRVREADGENQWWGEVWAQKEHIEDVTAVSEEEAKEEAKEILYATTEVVTSDIDSISVREVA